MAILSNINGKFAVDSSGGIQFSGQTGTSGYVLKSNGNAAPTWVDGSTVIGGPYLPLSGGTLTGATATASGISFTVGGVLTGTSATFSGDVNIGQNESTATRQLTIGQGRTGNGFSFIDLVGDATYTDYGFRMLRGNGGANSLSLLDHRGTGEFQIKTQEAAPIVFKTTATERMRIDSSGVVSITNGSSDGLIIERTGTTTGKYRFGIGGTNLLTIRDVAQSSTRMAIDSSGNVGIGTTSPNNFTNQTSLTVSGTSLGRVDVLATAGGGGGIYGSTSQMKMFSNYGMNLALESGTGGIVTFATSATERMRITSAGRVTIKNKPNSGLAYDVLISVGTGADGDVGYQTVGQLAANIDVELLDNYEEGTWTPAINGVTASTTGRYIKIGNMVKVSGTIVQSSGSSSNNIITGLPFTTSGASRSPMNFSQIDDCNWGSGATMLVSFIYVAQFAVYGNSNNSGLVQPPGNWFSTSSFMEFGGTYEIF